MGLLDGRRLLLGVGGGIAAYKAPELVRRLREAGASVRVVLTDAGARFVSELALEVVSRAPVGRGLWEPSDASGIVHTDLGKEVDLIVLAPATANLIGRIRHGLADDLLSTTVMACHTPVLVCPSMNSEMLANPLVRENIEALAAQPRFKVLEPGSGLLACGVTGPGRLPDPPEIIEAAAGVLTPTTLEGVRVAVSAGPTREALDPVRFLTNRSSGTMGYALARAFAARGADVTLISGPTGLRTPVGVTRRVDITSAAEAAVAVEEIFPSCDVLVMAAAIADYRPATRAEHKLKKDAGPLHLALERTTDILATVAARPDRAGRVLIGFAAETRDVEALAREKLDRKGLDWIIANDVAGVGVGFGTGDNAGMLVGRDGTTTELRRASKDAFAERVVDLLGPAILERLARG
ncbi:MAG: bifunctional phosphopantothenoylcysteine decarboxylase/phosphopantothenate--cysteine ligase CoaBC [Deltaproteobacteria bacterium]|nr:bifunctional phosphopantothenoylcysteine decarboxylase/phosphopantothenate--cysteine ligase CoaBC [Deltaproteobacteria bacterium]MCB9785158.1 bifunctional phosphopantothenoylcysteine decarboxylase/phosphopantothenate--cysteine ligase CoaBC [Deltaproteobacteria bacterium]